MDQPTTRVMPGIATIKRFLQAVLQAAQQEGWPVNAYLIGPDVFRGDPVANWYAIKAVLDECQHRQLLTLTTGGEIQGMSEVAEVLALSSQHPARAVNGKPHQKPAEYIPKSGASSGRRLTMRD